MPANRNIFDLLTICSSQWQYDFNGRPSSLSWLTVIEVADRIGIETDELFFEKLRAWENEVRRQMKI